MSHTGVEVFDFLLLTVYPVAGLLAVELACRVLRAPKWAKLWTQAAVSVGFAVAYLTFPGDQSLPLTAAVLLALAVALAYQGRRARISPEKSPY